MVGNTVGLPDIVGVMVGNAVGLLDTVGIKVGIERSIPDVEGASPSRLSFRSALRLALSLAVLLDALLRCTDIVGRRVGDAVGLPDIVDIIVTKVRIGVRIPDAEGTTIAKLLGRIDIAGVMVGDTVGLLDSVGIKVGIELGIPDIVAVKVGARLDAIGFEGSASCGIDTGTTFIWSSSKSNSFK